MRDDGLFRLERTGLLALAEYVPGSELIVGDRLVRSAGLQRRWGKDGDLRAAGSLLYWARRGEALKYDFGSPIVQMDDGQAPTTLGTALLVKGGFAVPSWLPPVYRFDTERVGEVLITAQPSSRQGSEGPLDIELPGITSIDAIYDERGVILALNNGDNDLGFALCMVCGYASSESVPTSSGAEGLPSGFANHAPMWSRTTKLSCKWEDPKPRRHLALAAKQETNVLRLRSKISGGFTNVGAAAAASAALAMAGARLMQIDSRELGATASSGSRGYEAILWDNNPGGSGLLRDLCSDAVSWFDLAKQILWVNQEHHTRCKSGCIRCLLGFSTQTDIARQRFDRSGAYHALSA